MPPGARVRAGTREREMGEDVGDDASPAMPASMALCDGRIVFMGFG